MADIAASDRRSVSPQRAADDARRVLALFLGKPRRGDRPRLLCAARARGDFCAVCRARTGRPPHFTDAKLMPPSWEEGGRAGIPARHRRGRPRHPLAAHLRRRASRSSSASWSWPSPLTSGIVIGLDRRLFPRLGRHRDHAPDGHHPGVSLAAPGAGSRRRPRTGPDQRDDRNRARLPAAFRAADARIASCRSGRKDYVVSARVAGAGRSG